MVMITKNKIWPKKRKYSLIILLIMLASMVSCAKKEASNPLTPDNRVDNEFSDSLVVNNGFETDTTGVTQSPYGWGVQAEGKDINASHTTNNGHSGKYALEHKNNSAYKIFTYQTLTKLPNGYYSLWAWIKNGGDQNSCYLSGKGSDGIEKMTSLPKSSSWIPIVVRGIHVIDGKCTFGVSSDANSNNWCQVDDIQLVKDDIPFTFLKGGDLSELTYIESKGGKFSDNGVQKDCIQILKDHGFNIVRLRLYNDPGNPNYSPSKRLPAGIQDTTDILNLSRRSKAAGMQIELTFHYSDYWTNPGTQNKPHAWASLTYAQLKTAVYDFTFNFMIQMQIQGTTPEYVSLGNETRGGILFPDGSTSNFGQLAELFNQGYDAVKAVSPSTKVIIHIDDGGNASTYDWFFGLCNQYGVKYDLIGASYYPFWTGKTVAQINTWANYVSAKFNKDIFIMETGYNWNPTLPNGSNGQLSSNGPYASIYPSSPTGQRDFLYECFSGLKTANNGRVIGDLYWDPIMIEVSGVGWELGGSNVISNTTLFNFSGNALPALKAFQYNN
jgi:arabinogalactan endo-1,4-beta-galactosidase